MQRNGKELRAVALGVVLAVMASAVYLVAHPALHPNVIGENVHDEPTQRSYESALYGIRFSYPNSYVVTERDISSEQGKTHHAIAIVNKIAAANSPVHGEGPTEITIDIYGNEHVVPLDTWIRTMSASNFKLSANQRLSTSTIAGLAAYSYSWNGLYHGDTVVLQRRTDTLMFAVTYMENSDLIRDNFHELLATLVLQ